MSVGITSNNVTTKVSAAASSGMTVPANSMAIASYVINAPSSGNLTAVELTFGPGQTVPASISSAGQQMNFAGGVVINNSP